MGHVILVSGYPDSCQLTTTWMYRIMLQATILARKCEISHRLLAFGRTVRRTYGHVTTKISGLDSRYRAFLTRSSRARGAPLNRSNREF